jgi:hypothetical protein
LSFDNAGTHCAAPIAPHTTRRLDSLNRCRHARQLEQAPHHRHNTSSTYRAEQACDVPFSSPLSGGWIKSLDWGHLGNQNPRVSNRAKLAGDKNIER